MLTGMAGFFHPSPLLLPMRDVLLKHLTLFPCQENKNEASVRSCAVLEADAVLCLAEGREGLGGEAEGSRESRCHGLCKALQNTLRISLGLEEGGHPEARYQEARICSFYLTNSQQEISGGSSSLSRVFPSGASALLKVM